MNRTIMITLYADSHIDADKVIGQDTFRDFMRAMCNTDKYQLSLIIDAITRRYAVTVDVVEAPSKDTNPSSYGVSEKQQQQIYGGAYSGNSAKQER